MNEKKIIVPSRGGIASLDIRRIQRDLKVPEKSEFGVFKQGNGMPETMRKHAVEEMERCIELVKGGEVHSLMLAVIGDCKDAQAKGNVVVCVKDDEIDEMGELIALAFDKHPQLDPEAG